MFCRKAETAYLCTRSTKTSAEIAQLVEHNLAKVGVASSSLVFRSPLNVNRNKLRGMEKLKYQFYDKVMRCKAQSADWQQFDKALRAEGLKLRFHYNNVNGKLMGVVFTDGKYTFSGRQLDNELKLSALTEKFGDLKQITHDNVRDWYEDYRQQLHYINDWQGCKAIDHAYPDFDRLFPNGKLPFGGYTSTDGSSSGTSVTAKFTRRSWGPFRRRFSSR